MPYEGSYVWRLRQKVGHDKIITSCVCVIVERYDGKLLMVYNKDFNEWVFPGGIAEMGDSWADAALTELREEAGIIADKDDLIPFASVSGAGYVVEYPNGDSAQIFQISYIVRNWKSETDNIDQTEILEKKYFYLEEIAKLNLHLDAKHMLSAYKEFLKTDQFQTIEIA